MPRIRIQEDFDEKKTSIVLATLNIIFEEGLDNFSVNYLLRKLKISKGSFFHYFDSKEDLLADVIDYASQPFISIMESVIGESDLRPKEKLIKLYRSIGSTKVDLGKGFEYLVRILLHNENKFFIMEIMEKTLKECLPAFENLIAEGVRAGDFSVEYPAAAASHILSMTMRLNTEIGEFMLSEKKDGDKNKLMDKMKFSEKIIGKILNCDVDGMLFDYDIISKIK